MLLPLYVGGWECKEIHQAKIKIIVLLWIEEIRKEYKRKKRHELGVSVCERYIKELPALITQKNRGIARNYIQETYLVEWNEKI